jgi:hypothetical protein
MTTLIRENYKPRGEIIQLVTERDGYGCYLCPEPFSEERAGMELTLDHVLPLSRGGTWDVENIKLAHRRCNQEKADRVFLDDGTLEPRSARLGYRERKANKEQILLEFCDLCANGRLLMPDEFCGTCRRTAVEFPRTMKRAPKDCSHSGYEWCWMDACGIIERTPAIVYVLNGEEIDD